MNKGLKRFLLIAAAAGLCGLLIWLFLAGRKEAAQERERDKSIKAPPRLSMDASGSTVVTLDQETQKRAGIEIKTIATVSLPPETVAYGRLLEDPSRSFVLRAPFAGVLRERSDRAWPRIGERLAAETVIGELTPRFAPVERIDLTSRLSAARADVPAMQASRAAAQASFDRLKLLNSEDKNVSDRVVQEAEARLKGEQARLEAAAETVKSLEAALAPVSGSQREVSLKTGAGGEVVELLAKPGETVESGQTILRLARFDRLLARVDLPAGEPVDEGISTARIVPLGYEDRSLRAQGISRAPTTDTKMLGAGYLFQVDAAGLSLRPGVAITAFLRRPGPAQEGCLIPREAVVRHEGKAWVYVRIAADRFVRREVLLDGSAAGGWFQRSGFSPGDKVVAAGAQLLLSEELKLQIQIGEEAEKE